MVVLIAHFPALNVKIFKKGCVIIQKGIITLLRRHMKFSEMHVTHGRPRTLLILNTVVPKVAQTSNDFLLRIAQ